MPESLGPSGPLRGWPGGLAVGRSIGDRCAHPLPSSLWVLPPPSMRALDTAPPPPHASARVRSPPLDSIGEQRLRRLGLCRAERHDRGAAARGRRPPRTPLALAFQPTHAFACFGDSLNRLDPSYYSQRDPHRTLRPDPPGRICHLRTAAYAAGALGPSDSPQKTDSLHTHTHASSLAPRLRNGAGLPCLSQWCGVPPCLLQVLASDGIWDALSPKAVQHGQSGRLGEAIAGHRGRVRLRRKAWGRPPHS